MIALKVEAPGVQYTFHITLAREICPGDWAPAELHINITSIWDPCLQAKMPKRGPFVIVVETDYSLIKAGLNLLLTADDSELPLEQFEVQFRISDQGIEVPYEPVDEESDNIIWLGGEPYQRPSSFNEAA